MMFTIVRNIRSTYPKFLSSGLRFFSTERTNPEFCYLLGMDGVLKFPGSKFQKLDDYFLHNPFLSQVPQNRLFGTVNKKRPYILQDQSRLFIRSGALVPFMANQNHVLLTDLFMKGNVGVLKDTELLVFKELGKRMQISGPVVDGYHAYGSFLKGIIAKMYSNSSLSRLPLDLDNYLSDLSASKVGKNMILYHPTTLYDLQHGEVCVDVYRTLVKELPVLNQMHMSNLILKVIGSGNRGCMKKVLNNGLLPQFLPFSYQKIYPANCFPWTKKCYIPPMTAEQVGSVVVHILRHGYIHALEAASLSTVRRNFPHVTQFTRDEVIQLLRWSFPNGLRSALPAFRSTGIISELHLEERNPIP